MYILPSPLQIYSLNTTANNENKWNSNTKSSKVIDSRQDTHTQKKGKKRSAKEENQEKKSSSSFTSLTFVIYLYNLS